MTKHKSPALDNNTDPALDTDKTPNRVNKSNTYSFVGGTQTNNHTTLKQLYLSNDNHATLAV